MSTYRTIADNETNYRPLWVSDSESATPQEIAEIQQQAWNYLDLLVRCTHLERN